MQAPIKDKNNENKEKLAKLTGTYKLKPKGGKKHFNRNDGKEQSRAH